MPERGSTLLEVLVALAVLGIGVAGSARLLLLGLATESQAALREVATLRLADAAELSWAWSGAPPAARLADWRAAATLLRPDAAESITASLQQLPATAGSPQPLRASLRWGDNASDSTELRTAVYAPARP